MKNLKISTELASAVLGKEVTKCSLINKTRNSINITYFEDKEDFNTICREWNIYEFAFKCKEWAYIKGFKLLDECNAIIITSLVDRELHIVDNDFKVPYKIERIIEACNWILELSNEKI